MKAAQQNSKAEECRSENRSGLHNIAPAPQMCTPSELSETGHGDSLSKNTTSKRMDFFGTKIAHPPPSALRLLLPALPLNASALTAKEKTANITEVYWPANSRSSFSVLALETQDHGASQHGEGKSRTNRGVEERGGGKGLHE